MGLPSHQAGASVKHLFHSYYFLDNVNHGYMKLVDNFGRFPPNSNNSMEIIVIIIVISIVIYHCYCFCYCYLLLLFPVVIILVECPGKAHPFG